MSDLFYVVTIYRTDTKAYKVARYSYNGLSTVMRTLHPAILSGEVVLVSILKD